MKAYNPVLIADYSYGTWMECCQPAPVGSRKDQFHFSAFYKNLKSIFDEIKSTKYVLKYIHVNMLV
jgi:hypothetical protein